MKTITYVAGILFFLLPFFVRAQSQPMKAGSSIAFGIKAGVNLGNVIENNGPDRHAGGDLLTAPFGGLYVTIPAKEGFAIQPEVVYNTLGWKYDVYTGTDVKYTFGYISVPVLAKYTFSKPGFMILLGPQIDFLLSAKSKADKTQDIKAPFKTTAISGVGEVGYLFGHGINLSGRYQIQATNILKDGSNDKYLGLHAVTFTVGYTF